MDTRVGRALSLQSIRFLENFFRARILGRQNLLPQICLVYLTYLCNAHCGFCSRTKEVNGHCQGACELARFRQILEKIAEVTTCLYLTGGEGTILRDLVERLDIARELRFWPIIFNTNAIWLDRHWTALSRLDKLVVSLHSTDPLELARIYRVKPEWGQRALNNIEEAARGSKIPGNCQVMANLVLTPDNIAGANRVLDFCLARGIELTVVPAICGQRPLIESGGAEAMRAYTRFLDRVIAQKKDDPWSIQGSLGYLQQIRQLKPVDCRPSAILSISPAGQILDACDRFYGTVLGNIDETTSTSALSNRFDRHARFRSCPHRCLKVCYTQTALLYAQPWQTAMDYITTWL